MTFTRREEILSKDILTIADVQELNGITYQPAARIIRNIKRVMKSQYQVSGRVATSDYIKFFDGQVPKEEPQAEIREVAIKPRKTVRRDVPLFRVKDYANK